jgi:hypothetical protein
MPAKAKSYVAAVIVAGAALLAASLAGWQSAEPTRFYGVLLLAMAAATRKVRLPRTTSNISIGFLFILLAIAEFSLAETAVLAAATALVQSMWTLRRPRFAQVSFNVATLALSAAAAHWATHRALNALQIESHAALLSLATVLFFLADTWLVAFVLSLTESKPAREVWQQCCLWAFPYYFVGSGIAALITVASHSVGWAAALLVLPLMYLVYIYYRLYVERNGKAHLHLSA